MNLEVSLEILIPNVDEIHPILALVYFIFDKRREEAHPTPLFLAGSLHMSKVQYY